NGLASANCSKTVQIETPYDEGFTAANALVANTHVMLTRTPAAQNSITFNTLKLVGKGPGCTLNGGQKLTLANGGILKAGGGPSVISGGTGASLSPSSELAVRTATSRDSLTISVPITGNQALTKSGAGTLILSGTNTYTGQTFINGGMLSISANSGLGDVATGATNLFLNNTTLQATASFTLDNGGANRRTIVVANNCGIDVLGAHTLTVSGSVSGSGHLAKIGTGTLVLTGANVMGGAITVVNGTLVIPASASLNGATLSLGGNGTTVMQLSTSSVSICTSSVLTYGGTLVVTNVNASLVAGASFKLFDAADYTGAFASISLPVLEPGLKWITTDLAVSGTIRVVAPLSLAAVFTDNMVLQRDRKVPVWGEAESGEKVTVEFGGQRKTVKAGRDWKWMVRLDAMVANAIPQTLTVTGPGSITRVCTNVLVGDVWLASGQSNMHVDVNYVTNSATEIARANYPLIRSLKVNLSGATTPNIEASLSRPWTVCSSNTVSKWSAVAYFFARDVFQKTKVPIGILESPNPGTIAEAWTSREALNAVPELKTFANSQIARYYQGKVNLTDAPGSLFNAMISPLIPFAIKGAIWYQGESNCHRGEQYRVLLPTLIQDWRNRWQQGAFSFYIVQLASFSAGWPYGDWDFRSVCEAQLITSKTVINTGLAVTMDIRENAGDIHPKVKQDVGARLAVWALNRDYGFRDVVPSGPMFRNSKIEGSQIRMTFDYAEGGLMIGQKNGLSPVQELAGIAPAWFEIAGTNNVFTNATASIDSNNTVVVSSPAVPNPAAVRYAWFKIASGTNLYNRAGLPASPFRTFVERTGNL
ncbi:MAG: autotransporter-associated beta strand repeat-containing protein, partial [bacterium]